MTTTTAPQQTKERRPPQQEIEESAEPPFVLAFISSLVRTIASALASKPFENIKILAQTAASKPSSSLKSSRGDNSIYVGFCPNFKAILERHRLLGLYRGMDVIVLRHIMYGPLMTLIREVAFAILSREGARPLLRVLNLLGGFNAVVGAILLLLQSPLDNIHRVMIASEIVESPDPNAASAKTRAEVGLLTATPAPSTSRQLVPRGPVDAAKIIYGHSGIVGFFRGWTSAVVAVYLYRLGFWVMWDPLVRALLSFTGGAEPPSAVKFLAGWFVSSAAALLTFPMDTVRTRLVIAPLTGEAFPLAFGATTAAYRLIEEKGPVAVWAGAVTTLIRSAAGALAVAVVDWFLPY